MLKFSLFTKRFSFRAPIWAFILTLLGVTLFCKLGFWQLYRGQEKQAIIQQVTLQEKAEILTNEKLPNSLVNNSERYIARKVKLTGTFLNNKSILVDNVVVNREVGYEVLTPLVLPDHRVLLISRGWIALLNHSRHALPPIPPIYGTVLLTGRIEGAKKNNWHVNQLEIWRQKEPNLPIARIQKIEFEELKKVFEKGDILMPYYVRLDSDSPYVLTPLPEVSDYLNPERHLGYAVQWFGLAVTAVLLFLFINIKEIKVDE